jgi:predicted RNA-binding Zn ribbon-like protein
MAGQSVAEQHVGQAPGDLATLQAFVNTLDIEQATDELDSPPGLAGWLRGAGLLDPRDASATPAGLDMALELREALRGVLRSHVAPPPGAAAPPPGAASPSGAPAPPPAPGSDPLADLRRISARLPTRLEVTADGRIGLAAAGSGVLAALARILLIAADSATLGTWPRLKVCSADDCQWAFYDRSPTRSGCWCSMRVCGSRAKSRAYRRRAAAAG